MENTTAPLPIKNTRSQVSLNPATTAVTLVIIAVLGFIVYRQYVQADFGGSLNVDGGTLYVDALNNLVNVSGSFNTVRATISNNLQIPVDTTDTVTEGSLQFSTATNSLQVYKDSDGWVDVGGVAIPIPETVTGLVEGVDDPLNVFLLHNSFNGGTITVNSELTFNNAITSAAENVKIQFTSNITFASAVTIPNKSLWIDLNGFIMTVPMSVTGAIVCQQSGKNIYFFNGTVQYASGTTGSSSGLISGTNCFLFIRDVTLLHAEYAVLLAGNSGNRLTFYSSGSTYTLVKARSSNNNTYGPIGLFGMVTDDSFVYLRGCTFDTLSTDTFLTATTDRYIMRGVVRAVNNTHLSGSCTITGCTIDPAHNVQAVFYSDVFSSTGTRGSFRLRIDRNTIGNSATREQLIVLIGFKPLNCFSSVYILENTFQRMDSNKGIMYVDAVSGAGGSTDIYIFNNTFPVMKTVDAVSFTSTYTRNAGTNVNVVTSSPHNFTPGYLITVTGSVGGLSNGAYIVQTVVSSTEFTTLDTVSGVATGTTTVVDNFASSARKIISKDGVVRGPTSLVSIYLQKYDI